MNQNTTQNQQTRHWRLLNMHSNKTGMSGRAAALALRDADAVLFDLDGTLVDSMWMWKEIDIEYLGRFGYTCPPDLQKIIEGMSFSETAEYFKSRFQIPDSIDEIKAAWIQMSIEKYRNEVPLKPGALRLLQYLERTGKKAGIATSNGRDMVDAVLESLQIRPCFRLSQQPVRWRRENRRRIFIWKLPGGFRQIHPAAWYLRMSRQESWRENAPA